MEKLYCLLLGAMLALVSMAPAHAQKAPSQVEPTTIQKLVEQSKYYTFNRMKTMCEEWPGCEEWALARRKENPSFTIIDAEVEYYVVENSGWHFWQHNFYVKTMENLQEQSYVFKTEINRKSENPYHFQETPKPIAKFPGHPFSDMPSRHAKYELEERYGVSYHSQKMLQRWPNISNEHWYQMGASIEQQRVIWDEEGSTPLRWVRRLDYLIDLGVYPTETTHYYAVIARQNKLGEPFKYFEYNNEELRKINSILIRAEYIPNFYITVKYRTNTVKYYPKEVSNK